MMASGFKPVGWVAAVGGAALGCYMLSLQVAAERADVTSLDRRIVAARQQIRSLQTELGTRGRLQQLEAWNDDVLALAAPGSGQFLEGDVSLARFEMREPQVGAQTAEVRLASADVPVAPAPATAVPAPAHAAPAPAPQRAVAERSAVAPQPPIAQPVVRRISLSTVPEAAPATTSATPAPRARPATEPAKSLRPAPTTERSRPTTGAATATAERTRTAAAPTPPRTRTATTATPPAARARTAAATTAPTRPRPTTTRPARSTFLLSDRAARDLRTAARAERNRGTAD